MNDYFPTGGLRLLLLFVPLLVGSIVCLAGGLLLAVAILMFALERVLKLFRAYGLFIDFIFERGAAKARKKQGSKG